MATKKNENIIIISGEDNKRVKEEIKKIEDRLNKKKDIDIVSYFAEEVETTEVIGNCNTSSIFAPKTLIKYYDFNKANLNIIENYVNDPNPNAMLLLITFQTLKDLGSSKVIKNIISKSKIIEIKTLYDNQVLEKIHKKLQSMKLKYNNDIVEYIARQVGNSESGIDDFFEVISETGIVGKIEMEDIKEIQTITSEKNLFSFLDYFFNQNIISAINSYKSLVNEGTPILLLNRMIYNKSIQYLNFLSLSEQGKNKTEIMSEIKVTNQWFFNKISQEAKMLDFQKLKFILINCYEIDKAIKSESQDIINNKFELFLINFKKNWLNI